MNDARRVVEGTACLLSYEYCCLSGGLFNEAYLAGSVGRILQSIFGGKSAQVIGGYQHPVLASQMEGRGRRPEVDFVVAKYDDSSATQRARSIAAPARKARRSDLLLAAIETKWAGSGHCTFENLMWDLLRLEMLVAENPKVMGLLLVAGRLPAMLKLRDESGVGEFLSFASGPSSWQFTPKAQGQIALLREFMSSEDLQDLDLPSAVNSSASAFGLDGGNPGSFCAVGWEISPNPKRKTFKPKDIREYRKL